MDSLECAFEQKYLRKYGIERYKKQFIYTPTIKDTIHIEMGFDPIPTWTIKDTIEIYLNNQLVTKGEYPANKASWVYFPNLPMQVNCTYKNSNRLSKASLLIVSHADSMYYDTIIPLKFKYLHIGHPSGSFNFRFEKALD